MHERAKHTLLIIAPHPDDEVIGCSGLIQQVVSAGGRAYVQFMTVGDTNDFSVRGKSTSGERKHEIEQVVRFLGITGYDIAYDSDDYHLKLDIAGRNELMEYLGRGSTISIQAIKPSIVAFPSMYSYNQDHQAVAHAVHTALRPAERDTKHFVDTVVAYEMPADGWSLDEQRQPCVYVPMTEDQVARKVQAMELYASQVRPVPNPRAGDILRALCRLRGALCAQSFAEAYIPYRTCIP